MEEWKNLKLEGFEHYQVSNLGNFKGPRGVMKPRINARGYMILGLRNKSSKQKMILCHREVAKCFVDNEFGKKYVNHIDGNKTNNDATNLEWVTQSENQIHAYKIGLQKITEKHLSNLMKHSNSKKKKVKVTNSLIGLEMVFDSMADSDKYFGFYQGKTSNLITKGINCSKGYKAEYF